MDIRQAQAALAGEELVPVMVSSLQNIKQIRDQCLEVDLPALVGDQPGKG